MGNNSSLPSSVIDRPEMPPAVSEPSPIQGARRRVHEAPPQRTRIDRVRSSSRIRKKQEKAHPDRFGRLPPELVLEVTKWTNIQDLGNFVFSSSTVSELASTSKRAISKGIQAQQYQELHQTFGMVGEETPDQKWYLVGEEENRKWWLREDRRRYGQDRGREGDGRHEDRQGHSRESLLPLTPGCIGRINFFAALAEDMEKTAAALKEAKCITANAGSEGLTRQALLLCQKLQWIDRPGLEHLCSQDDTVHDYLELRRELFDAEAPEVRTRFQEIMRLVGSRVWKRLELWDWTREWSTRNKELIARQQYIGCRGLKMWVREVTAELAVEVVSKIGLDRAIKLDYTHGSIVDMIWINEKVIDRLEELLDDMEKILRNGGHPPAYGFGGTIGLVPENIVDENVRTFSE